MDFPYLNENQRFKFPSIEKADIDGFLCYGGNMSPGMLLSAYEQGIFPWTEYQWFSPNPRMILIPKEIIISKSMKKILKNNIYNITFDTAFEQVIKNCKNIKRNHEDGTWITDDMEKAYIEMNTLGYSHSLEVWENNDLVGGLYGVSIGKCFFGESMFSKRSNTSKVAIITLSNILSKLNFLIIDCQVYTKHLQTLGAKLIPRKEFLQIVKKGLEFKTLRGNWDYLLNNT